MAEAYRLYAGTQAGMILFRGVGDIWTSMGGSREFEPYFKDKVVDSVYGCRKIPRLFLPALLSTASIAQRRRPPLAARARGRHPLGYRRSDR